MEEDIGDKKDYNHEKYDEERDAECHDDTSPVETEEGAKGINDDKNEIYYEENIQNAWITLPLMIWRTV